MKRILFFILFIIFPISVYAENIFDNYSIDIAINDNVIHVTERFDVIEASNSYSKRVFAEERYFSLIDTNIRDYQVIHEVEEYQDIVGTILPNESYYLEYTVSDVSEYGDHMWKFYKYNNTLIKELSFKIEKSGCNVDIFEYDDDLIKYNFDGNLIAGSTKKESSNVYFTVGYQELYFDKNNVEDEKTEINEIVFGTIPTKILSISSLLFVLLALFLVSKNKYLALAATIVTFLSLIFQCIMINPLLLVVAALYSLFYIWFFTKNVNENIGMEIFVFSFIAFHSFFFMGGALGIVPHIINYACLFFSSRMFRNYYLK